MSDRPNVLKSWDSIGDALALDPLIMRNEAIGSFAHVTLSLGKVATGLVGRSCLILIILALSSCTQEPENPIPAYDFERYSLFTWKTNSEEFCFAIIVRAHADKFLRSRSAKKDAKCGASELKGALIALPKDSQVFWEDWPPKKFYYPPDNVVAEIIDFAKSNGIHLEQSPSLR